MKEIWFGIAYGQILSMFVRVICLQHDNGRVLNVFISLVKMIANYAENGRVGNLEADFQQVLFVQLF